MLATVRRGPAGYLVLIVLFLVASITYLGPYGRLHLDRFQTTPDAQSPRNAAANATLGFQRILALSTTPSWRTRGLRAAAEYTGLEIDIPGHSEPPPQLVKAFRTLGSSKGHQPKLGAARAWLSHLDLLKYVVQSGFDTALIIEDDVDWDITLKYQMRLASDAVRKYTDVPATDPTPYGRNWDILWLGHCGELTDKNAARIEYPDPSVLMQANYTGWSSKYLPTVAEGHRVVQHGLKPVCTFAYAVTSEGARNVLSWAGYGEEYAFDTRLSAACRQRHLNIVTVNPEIMHHYTPPRDAGYWSEINEADGWGVAGDEADFENVMGGTENILNSTRCKVLFDSTCVKPFRDKQQ